MKGIPIKQKEVKAPLIVGDTIPYTRYYEDLSRLLKLIYTFSKVTGYKMST